MTRLALALLLVAEVAVAQPRVKPWKMTSAERAAMRLDPAERTERVREYAMRLQNDRRTSGSAPLRCDDVIDGAVHPELLFPAELIRDFARAAFVKFPELFPKIAAQEAPELFSDPGNWSRLAAAIAPYVTLLKDETTLASELSRSDRVGRRRIEQELAKIQAREPAERAAALRSARLLFGRERFDQALYEMVGRQTVQCHTDTTGDGGAASINAILKVEAAAQ